MTNRQNISMKMKRTGGAWLSAGTMGVLDCSGTAILAVPTGEAPQAIGQLAHPYLDTTRSIRPVRPNTGFAVNGEVEPIGHECLFVMPTASTATMDSARLQLTA